MKHMKITHAHNKLRVDSYAADSSKIVRGGFYCKRVHLIIFLRSILLRLWKHGKICWHVRGKLQNIIVWTFAGALVRSLSKFSLHSLTRYWIGLLWPAASVQSSYCPEIGVMHCGVVIETVLARHALPRAICL